MNMKKWKFTPPQSVSTVFNNTNDIDEIIAAGKLYKRESFIKLTLSEYFDASDMENIFEQYSYLDTSDFSEIEDVDSRFKKMIRKLTTEISGLKCNKHEAFILTILDTDFSKNLQFLINHNQQIVILDDNASAGINDNISTHLKNKKRYLNNFRYKIELVVRDEVLEEVSKYYYYQEDYINSVGTGAGALTGWLTQEVAERRLSNKTLIKLNSNFRLKK